MVWVCRKISRACPDNPARNSVRRGRVARSVSPTTSRLCDRWGCRCKVTSCVRVGANETIVYMVIEKSFQDWTSSGNAINWPVSLDSVIPCFFEFWWVSSLKFWLSEILHCRMSMKNSLLNVRKPTCMSYFCRHTTCVMYNNVMICSAHRGKFHLKISRESLKNSVKI